MDRCANTTVGSWFAWANSVFAQTILDLAHRKPHLIFEDAKPYILDEKQAARSIWNPA